MIKKIVLIGLLLFFFSLVVFHEAVFSGIYGLAFKLYTTYFYGENLTYDAVVVDGNKITVCKPRIKGENSFEAECVSLNFEMDWRSRQLNLIVDLEKPIWQIQTIKSSGSSFKTLLSTKRMPLILVNPICNVKEGILKWHLSDQVERSVRFDLDLNSLVGGHLCVQMGGIENNKDNDFTLEALSSPEGMLIGWDCNQVNCSALVKLAALFYPRLENLEIYSGATQGYLTAVFPEVERPYLKGELILNNLSFAHPYGGLKGKVTKARVKLDKNINKNENDWYLTTIGQIDILEKASLSSTSNGATVWQLEDIIGSIQIDPDKNTFFSLNALGSHEKNISAYQLLGRANLNSKRSFYMDFDLLCTSANDPQGSVQFHMHQPEGSSKIVEVESKKISYKHWGFVQALFATYWKQANAIQFHDGLLDAHAHVEVSRKGIAQVKCNHLEATKLSFDVLPWDMSFNLPKWTGKGSVNLSQPVILQTLDAEMHVENGHVNWEGLKDIPLSDIQTHLVIKQGSIRHSLVKLQLAGLKGIMDIEWTDENKLLTTSFEGKAQDIAELMPKKLQTVLQNNFHNNNVGVTSIFKYEAGKSQIEGAINIQREPDSDQLDLIHFGYEIKKGRDVDNKSKGWFYAKEISLEKFISPFIFRNGVAKLTGIGEFTGSFDPDKVNTKYRAQDMQIENKNLLIKIGNRPLVIEDELSGSHTFNLKTLSHEGLLPISNSTYFEKNTGLTFENIQSQVHFKDETIQLKALESNCGGIHMAGQIDLDYSDPAPGVFNVSLNFPIMNGKVSEVQRFLLHLDKPQILAKIPLEGDVETHKKGLQVIFEFIPKDYDLKAHFEGVLTNGALPIQNMNMTVQDLGMNVEYRHENEFLTFNEIQGTLLAGKPHQVQEFMISGDHICFKGSSNENIDIDIDIEIIKQESTFAKLVGKTDPIKKGLFKFSLNKELSHFCHIYPTAFELIIEDWSNIQLFQLKAPFKLSSVWPDIHQTIVQTGLFFPKGILDKITALNDAEGDCDLSLDYQGSTNILSYQMLGNHVKLNTFQFEKCLLNGNKLDKKWNINQFQMDQFSLTANLQHEIDEWRVDGLTLNYGSGILLGFDGKFSEKSGSLDGSVHFFELNLTDLNDLPMFKSIEKNWITAGIAKGRGHLKLEALDQAPWYSLDATLQTQLQDFRINDCALQVAKPIAVHYKTNQLFEVHDIDQILISDLQVKHGYIGIKHAFYNLLDQKFGCSQVAFNIPFKQLEVVTSKINGCFPNLLDDRLIQVVKSSKKEGSLAGSINFQKDMSSHNLKATFEDGIYFFRDREYELKNLEFTINPHDLTFSAISQCESCIYRMTGNAKLPDLNNGELILIDWPSSPRIVEPLHIVWNDFPEKGFQLESVKGNFCGLNISLNKTKRSLESSWSELEGLIEIDFKALCPLLSQTLAEKIQDLDLGSNYGLKGSFWMNPTISDKFLQTLYFKGNLVGSEVNMKGFLIEKVKGELNFSPGFLEVSNFGLYDSGGQLDCPKMEFTQNLANEEWWVSIPDLTVNDLKPSLMRDLQDPATSKYKNLVIREISFEDYTGNLNDITTWAGSGSLRFLNPSRMNAVHPLLAIPAEIILRLGLNPHVLNPVTGTVIFELRGDKLYLTKFKDVYSEGRGSKFYLANQEPSWMDIHGNLFVQIKMKQYNLFFKLAELFTVSVEGNLKKPTYSLQRHHK